VNETITEEIDRITSLGLSPIDVRAWYKTNILMPTIRRASVAIVIASLVTFGMSTSLGSLSQSTLALHMIIGHFAFILIGFLGAYASTSLLTVGSLLSKRISQIRKMFQRLNRVGNRGGIATFVSAAALIAYWNIPSTFDAAVVIELAHLQMHLTLAVAGGLIFVGSTCLRKRARQIAPIIAGKIMGLYGVFLVLTPVNLYTVYSYYDQTIAGVSLITAMLLMDFTIVPVWLYNYFGRTSQSTP